jgi:Iap family predicted aminopeptidase
MASTTFSGPVTSNNGFVGDVTTTALSVNGVSISAGAGAPTFAAAKGSLYLNTTGSSSSTRAYINTDGATTWTNITTAA